MEATTVYLETGKRRTFVCSLAWPGWCRSGRSAGDALVTLDDYAHRYRPVADRAGLAFPDVHEFEVVETLPGSGTTDYGAPGAIPEADRRPLDLVAVEPLVALMQAAWAIFDDIAAAAPEVLAKGPRGGGRDRDPMIDHVLDAERAYGRKIGVRLPPLEVSEWSRLREALVDTLLQPSDGNPVGGKGWPLPYAVRRITWHVLDHAWEMEDKGVLHTGRA